MIVLVLLATLAYICGQVFTHWRTEKVLARKFEDRTELIRQRNRHLRRVGKRVAIGLITAQGATMVSYAYLGHRGLKIAAIVKNARVLDKIKAIQRGLRITKIVATPITLPVRMARTGVWLAASPLRWLGRLRAASEVAVGGETTQNGFAMSAAADATAPSRRAG